ncbi:hypothetical protein GF386_06640 [Candidatus Pacearchaeota archaeon]|nr:hypothetical protein [Candidatus Pacearchaeota archaeon]
MNIEIRKQHIIALIVALVVIAGASILIPGTDIFYFLIGLAALIAGLPFFSSLILESNLMKEKEAMFLEFSRNLVENVKSGTPISKSILNVRSKDYGSLNPYINKLANQISLGIPIQTAFETFARDVESNTISRAIAIISESEKAGGKIENILDSVVKSVSQVETLRKERSAAIYSLVVQGYIIFFIFIIIMLVMQFKVLPIASGLSEGLGSAEFGDYSGGIGGLIGGGGEAADIEELTKPFVWLLTVQGLFAGLVIGKLSEGKIRAGLKHSFVLVILSLLIDTGAKLFM